jgi:hypothetical protein
MCKPAHDSSAPTPQNRLKKPVRIETALERRPVMPTVEQLLSKLNELRKDYQDDDDPDNLEFLALHHAFLFISYNMEAFKKYLQEAQKGRTPQ